VYADRLSPARHQRGAQGRIIAKLRLTRERPARARERVGPTFAPLELRRARAGTFAERTPLERGASHQGGRSAHLRAQKPPTFSTPRANNKRPWGIQHESEGR
jgi:hypothetical protein